MPYKDPEITIFLQFDFTERIFTLYYFNIFDILASVGGLKASIGPILSIATPISVLVFLIKLSIIIRDSLHESYIDEHKRFIPVAKSSLSALYTEIDRGSLRFQKPIHKSINLLLRELRSVNERSTEDKLIVLAKKVKLLLQQLEDSFCIDEYNDFESPEETQAREFRMFLTHAKFD